MNIKRILVLALALVVMAMPVGLAEAGYGTFTLSNIHLDMAGMTEPLDIDAALTIGVGAQEDGTGRVDVELVGGGQTAFSGSAGFDAEKIQAIVGGSSYYFEIPMAALEEMMAEGMEGAETSNAPDTEKIKRLTENYMKFLEKYKNPEDGVKFAAEMLAAINAEAKGKEQVDLFGEQMELYRFDASLDAAGIGKMYDVMLAADPDFKAFFVDYIDLIKEQSGEEIPLDPNDMSGSIAKALEEANVDMQIDFTFWVDTADLVSNDGKAVKEAINVTVTNLKPEGEDDANTEGEDDANTEGEDDVKTVVIPMNVSVLESDKGTRVAMDMAIAPEVEESMAMAFDATFDAPAADGGTESFGAFVVKFDAKEDIEDVDITLDFAAATGADKIPHFTSSLKGTSGGQALDLTVGYEGATATETEQSGTVTLDFNIPDTGKGNLAFDVKLTSSELKPLGEADLEGKTKVNPVSQDEEDLKLMEEAGVELNGVMMQAMGVLMQTPGLSNIMGSMMSTGTAG